MKDEVLGAPIRWAGSKKKVLNVMLESFKKNKDNYIEPFLGSGVVMINVLNNIDALNYKNIYVNDINSNIIGFYKMLKTQPNNLINSLLELSNTYNKKSAKAQEKMYYDIRKKFNESKCCDPTYFYFLMKVGFNGVYRENKLGKFNVPFGKKEKFVIQKDNMLKISKLIKKVKFYNLSYEKFLDMLFKKGILNNSFVYCDPPYIPDDKLVSQKQELYTSGNFKHQNFVNILKKYDDANIMISMSESTRAKDIYGKEFIIRDLSKIIRTINPQKLFKSSEILFLNYDEKTNK